MFREKSPFFIVFGIAIIGQMSNNFDMKKKHVVQFIENALGHFGTRSQLARKCGVSQRLVNFWLKGERLISLEHCLCIEEITKGEVKAVDIRPDLAETIEQLKRLAEAS